MIDGEENETMNNINKAHALIEDFEKKVDRFGGLDSLADGLEILCDILTVSDNEKLKQRGMNIVSTCQRFIISRVTPLLINPKNYTVEELEYWTEVVQILQDFTNEEEMDSLCKLLTRHKDDAEWEALPERERARRLEEMLKSLTEEEKAELRKQIADRHNINPTNGSND
jgi:hypothetical protein